MAAINVFAFGEMYRASGGALALELVESGRAMAKRLRLFGVSPQNLQTSSELSEYSVMHGEAISHVAWGAFAWLT